MKRSEPADPDPRRGAAWSPLGERLEVIRSGASACVRPIVGRVLVVEDEDEQRRMFEHALAEAGFDVTGVAAGGDALRALEREPFDIVLTDIGLPDGDGRSFCARFLRARAVPPIVVLVTGRGRTQDIVTGLDEGASDYVVKPIAPEVLVARIRAMLRLRNRLLERDRAANTDALTGLWNRAHLAARAEELVADLRRTGRRCCAMMIDVDEFKSINDAHGHAAGDRILREVARRIRSVVRRSDVLFRYGGEEFLVLAVDSDLASAVVLGDRIRRAVAVRPVAVRDAASEPAFVVPTVSVGVAPWRGDEAVDDTVDDAVRRADAALYTAKRRGRNRVEASRDAARQDAN